MHRKRLPWSAMRGYQHDISAFQLENDRCLVGAEMGLGKTVSTLTTVSARLLAGETHPTLVVAPKRVALSSWPGEARAWEHLSGIEVQPIIGSESARLAALHNASAAVFTTNYENIPWLVELYGKKWPFRHLILDESTKVKNLRPDERFTKAGESYIRRAGGSKRAIALARVAFTPLVKTVVELTGTPAPQGLIDLWGQIYLLDKGERLGRTFGAYKERWFTVGESGYGYELREGAEAEIYARLGDIFITLRSADYLQLPPLIFNDIRVDLPQKARALYARMDREFFAELENGLIADAANAAVKSQKLLQMANGAVYTAPPDGVGRGPWAAVHDAKLEAMEDVFEEAAGTPVLVAYLFESDRERLLKAFPDIRLLDADPQTIDDWNAGKIPKLALHPESAGHGLSLQHGGNILVLFSLTWRLEAYLQLIERIGPARQAQSGYNRPVFVHRIIAADTMDEVVLERLATNKSIQDCLIDAMKRRNGNA